MTDKEKLELTKARIELMKVSYPIVCFGLAGLIMVVTTVVAALPKSQLSPERWAAIMGVVSSAITAGAGIAQAPRNNGTPEGTFFAAQEHTAVENKNGKVDEKTTVIAKKDE